MTARCERLLLPLHFQTRVYIREMERRFRESLSLLELIKEIASSSRF